APRLSPLSRARKFLHRCACCGVQVDARTSAGRRIGALVYAKGRGTPPAFRRRMDTQSTWWTLTALLSMSLALALAGLAALGTSSLLRPRAASPKTPSGRRKDTFEPVYLTVPER